MYPKPQALHRRVFLQKRAGELCCGEKLDPGERRELDAKSTEV